MTRETTSAARNTRSTRTLRAVSDNLRPGQAIQAADQIFHFFEPRLREYFLNEGGASADRTVESIPE